MVRLGKGFFLRGLGILALCLYASCSDEKEEKKGGGGAPQPPPAAPGSGTNSTTPPPPVATQPPQTLPTPGPTSPAIPPSSGSSGCAPFDSNLATELNIATRIDAIVGKLDVTLKASLAANLKGTDSAATLNVVPSNIQVTPRLAQSTGEQAIREALSPRTFTYLEADKRRALSETNAEWRGINCTIIAVKQQTINSSKGQVVIAYEPALPLIMGVKSTADEFTRELAAGRTFTNIQARIVSSQNSKYQAGKTARGTATLRQKTVAGAEVGYELVYQFAETDGLATAAIFNQAYFGISTMAGTIKEFGIKIQTLPGQSADIILK